MVLFISCCRLKRSEERVLLLECDLILQKLIYIFILLSIAKLGICLVDFQGTLACLQVDAYRHCFVYLICTFLFDLEHLISIVSLIFIQPSVVGKFVPVLSLVDHSESFGRIHIELQKLVSVLKRKLVLQSKVSATLVIFFTDFVQIVNCFSVYPITTEQARAFSLLFTDDFATVDTIVNQGM